MKPEQAVPVLEGVCSLLEDLGCLPQAVRAREALSLLRAGGWETPEGYVLVPKEPTEAMLRAAWANAHDEDTVGVWKSMLAASPPPQEEERI